MLTPKAPETSFELYTALGGLFGEGDREQALVLVLLRLAQEVEALRTALMDPATPEAVRARYREAWAQTAVLGHDAAGPTGGTEKVLRRFFPWEEHGPFGPEQLMMERLGFSPEEKAALVAQMEEAQQRT